MKLKIDMKDKNGRVLKKGTEVRVATDAELTSGNAIGERAEIAAAMRALVREGKVVAFVPDGSRDVVYALSQNFDV